MSFDAGITQKGLGILDGVGVNACLLEGFELPTGEIERFGDLDGLMSVIAGDENGFPDGSFRGQTLFLEFDMGHAGDRHAESATAEALKLRYIITGGVELVLGFVPCLSALVMTIKNLGDIASRFLRR